MRGILMWLFLAQASGGTAVGQSLENILAKHVEALGGLDRIRAIRSVRMSGRVSPGGGREAAVVREIQKPGRVRTEFTYQGLTGVYAFDGERGWKVALFEGSLDAEPMTDEEALQTSDQADIEGPLVDWQAKGHRVALSGMEALDGLDVYKLEVTLRSGRVIHEYLDSRSYLRVRTESTREVRGISLRIETRFDDYREVSGLLFPHSIDTGVVGRPRRLTVTVETVEVNPTLDDARFAMPSAGR